VETHAHVKREWTNKTKTTLRLPLDKLGVAQGGFYVLVPSGEMGGPVAVGGYVGLTFPQGQILLGHSSIHQISGDGRNSTMSSGEAD